MLRVLGVHAMSALLRPCPFAYCRCPAKLIEIEVEDIEGRLHLIPRVIGTACGCQGPLAGMSGDMGKSIAMERWNSREPS